MLPARNGARQSPETRIDVMTVGLRGTDESDREIEETLTFLRQLRVRAAPAVYPRFS
jgi:hypothetical protein